MPERLPFPTAEELHEAQMEELKLQLHVAGVGRIQSYNAERQVADVVPQVRHPVPRSDGGYDFEDLPVLVDVPVLWPRMGKWFWAASVEPGDAVELLYDGCSPGRWRRQAETGRTGLDRIHEIQNPEHLTRHGLSNAVAIPGLDTWNRALRHAPGQRSPTDADAGITFGSDLDEGLRVSIKGDGSLTVTKGNDVRIEVTATGTVSLAGAEAATKALGIAELIDARLETLRAAFNAHTHTVAASGPVTGGSASVTGTAAAPTSVGQLASVAALKVKGV